MRSKYTQTLPVGLLCVSVALVGMLPGCASQRIGPAPDATRIAQRPTYPIEGTRPLFLGGYAGADYQPATRPSR